MCHVNARIYQGERLGIAVRNDLDEEVGLSLELGGVRQGLVPDFVQGIRGVGDELFEEDLLVVVKGVDDQAHQLGDFCLEREGLHITLAHDEAGASLEI